MSIRPEDHIGVAFDLFDSEQIPLDEALNRAVSQLSKANTEAHRDRLKQQIKNEWSNVSNRPFPENAFGSASNSGGGKKASPPTTLYQRAKRGDGYNLKTGEFVEGKFGESAIDNAILKVLKKPKVKRKPKVKQKGK